MSNPVLVLAHNCLEKTKKCVKSIISQDVPTVLCLFDSGSTDGTYPWAQENLPKGSPIIRVEDNLGVSYGWNFGITHLFSTPVNHILVLNNDVVIPPWFLRTLLDYDKSFISGVSVGSMEEIATPPEVKPLIEHPDFSGFLIGRDCWESVGLFDENLVHYTGDLDYHIRAHRKGIRLWNAGVPFFHDRSSTLRYASPKDRRIIELQADADRETFREKYGVQALGTEYTKLFDEKYFGIDSNDANTRAASEVGLRKS